MKLIYVFWTCKDQEEAKRVIYGLLEKKLIACASIFPEVESIFQWNGKIEECRETKVLLKTQVIHFEKIQSYIQSHCSYEVPEIMGVDVTHSNPNYLKWVSQETS